jgi:ADP-ribose pyrophosphatase YjhB (NUDIX family)
LAGEHLLLIRRGKPPRVGRWTLPGGAQKFGETVAQAASREVLEETGLQFEVGEVLAVVDLIERDGERVRYHYTLIDFSAEAPGPELRPGGDAAAARWWSASADRPATHGWGIPPCRLARKKAESRCGAGTFLRIPTQAGHLFRIDVGHRSDLMPARVPG